MLTNAKVFGHFGHLKKADKQDYQNDSFERMRPGVLPILPGLKR